MKITTHPAVKIYTHDVYYDFRGELWTVWKKDEFNPQSDFAAIMTCSSADEGCPFIVGAEKRFPIRYDDPKKYDGTDLMAAKYSERSIEIATEMYYVFSMITNG